MKGLSLLLACYGNPKNSTGRVFAPAPSGTRPPEPSRERLPPAATPRHTALAAPPARRGSPPERRAARRRAA